MSWSRAFFDPIELSNGRRLATLKDAAEYITGLPASEHDFPHWRAAIAAPTFDRTGIRQSRKWLFDRLLTRVPAGDRLPWTPVSGVLLMASPSIVPNERLDKDFYLVLEDFTNGAAFRETDEGIDYHKLITDLLTGQYDQVLRVVAFNPVEGWSSDVSEDIAHELEQLMSAEDLEVSDALRDFIESHTGRRIGAQLPLPLR